MQPSTMMRETIQEPCENVGSLLGLVMRELGESIMKKKKKSSDGARITIP